MQTGDSYPHLLLVVYLVFKNYRYAVGLFFTLRTHAHIYEESTNVSTDDGFSLEEGGGRGGGGHGPDDGSPLWSGFKSVAILLCATILLTLVAEIIVKDDNLEEIKDVRPRSPPTALLAVPLVLRNFNRAQAS